MRRRSMRSRESDLLTSRMMATHPTPIPHPPPPKVAPKGQAEAPRCMNGAHSAIQCKTEGFLTEWGKGRTSERMLGSIAISFCSGLVKGGCNSIFG
ncbi:hypothetical protein CDAR_63021 [Caerostris darwini]|uniref:Uncharacterized protein n=1 Tax=Caerostris darwini TaxID=1538125 RepID=A0AAV4UFG3_9ARAC|nr:hypothetical protein CDAR_63021 [Caerostris darwini]